MAESSRSEFGGWGWGRFGDALILAVCAAVIGLSAVLTPSAEAVSLFGREIPAVCAWQNLLGIGCPGCGLTRSFVYMAHGAFIEAFRMHVLGPVFFLLLAGQLPWRTWRLWAQRGGRAR